LEGLRLENVEIFNGYLEYYTDIWDILWPFGTFCVHLVHFSGFVIMYHEISGTPWKGKNFFFQFFPSLGSLMHATKWTKTMTVNSLRVVYVYVARLWQCIRAKAYVGTIWRSCSRKEKVDPSPIGTHFFETFYKCN
jgi:hypothetical protein